jgi:hypothetical protein
LIALVFLPTDVTFMMIPDHHFPSSNGLAVSVAPTGLPVYQRGALLAFAIHVHARVERVLQEGNDVPVPDWPPLEAGHPTFVRWSREVDPISCHRQQYPARAAEHSEPSKDKSDHLLQTLVGVETKPKIAVPDVAEGNGYSQFAPTGFRPSRIKHPGPQDAQLKFADAALHTQKKPVVWPTGVIDPVQINDAGFDKSA